MVRSALCALAVCASVIAMPALAQSPIPNPAPASKPSAAPPSATPPTEAGKPAEKAALLDINSATIAELSALKGIGDVRSAAIVKGRPYKGKDELVQKKIIPESVYADIKDKIIARQKAP